MSNLYEKINNLCKNKGIKASKMCDDLSMSRSFVTELKSGRSKSVTAETATKVANYFGVSVEYLMGEEQKEKPATANSNELTNDEIELLDINRRLPPGLQEQLENYAKFLLQQQGT